MAWKICNYRNGFLLLLSGAGLAGSAHSMEGFDEERRVIEEIIVVGTPPSSADISVIGGWFSFATVDLSDQFRSLDYFLGALRVANSNLIEASEQYCSHKIEGWRRDCHDADGSHLLHRIRCFSDRLSDPGTGARTVSQQRFDRLGLRHADGVQRHSLSRASELRSDCRFRRGTADSRLSRPLVSLPATLARLLALRRQIPAVEAERIATPYETAVTAHVRDQFQLLAAKPRMGVGTE